MNARKAGRRLMALIAAPYAVRLSLLLLARANLLPHAVWQRLPVNGRFTIRLADGTACQYASSEGDGIARVIYWRGVSAWEEETLDVFCHIAKQSRVVVDVGANTGIYTMMACAANPAATVYAFEPVPRIYVRLRENVRINQWQDRCVLSPVALSNVNGRATFHVPHYELPSSASLHQEGFHGMAGDLIEVDVRTFDQLHPLQQIDLVKIDVEGFEDKVLLGMAESLAASRPALIVECNPGGPLKEVQDILSRHSYIFLHITADRLVRKSSIEADQAGTSRNYLCLPPDKMHLVAARL